MTLSLDAFRDWRDMLVENTFFGIYNQPWLQAMLGLRTSDDPPRIRPGQDTDRLAYVKRQIELLRARMDKGGPKEAVTRAIVYIRLSENFADERGYEMMRRIRAEHGKDQPLCEFKDSLREQYFMLHLDEQRAVDLIPSLLKGHEAKGRECFDVIQWIVTADGPLQAEGQRRLARVERFFRPAPSAAPRPRRKRQTAAAKGGK